MFAFKRQPEGAAPTIATIENATCKTSLPILSTELIGGNLFEGLLKGILQENPPTVLSIRQF